MTTLALQIAPQRNTQYASLARQLAPLELQLSPLGSRISDLTSSQFGGQEYLLFELADDLTPNAIVELNMLSMTGPLFVLYAQLGGVSGPLLQPVEREFVPALPPELVQTRRYRGKTNEMFTHFMCNLARYSSDLAARPWSTLRLFDPLSGGGTTLFTALILGADAAGVEQNESDVSTSLSYLRNFLQDQRISHQTKQERLKGLGSRATVTIGKGEAQRCIFPRGNTTDARALLAGFRPHLIVADLPYGIQHQGRLEGLLESALPAWTTLLPPSGALVFSWDATRFSREQMIEVVQATSPLHVMNDGVYAELGHAVDRVIKRRDVLVARPAVIR